MNKLITEYNIEEEDDENNHKKGYLLYRNIQTTDANHYKIKSAIFNNFFLDYAFRQKRSLISKAKNKVNLNNYCYELENTISLNLEILLSFLSNAKTNSNKKILISYDNKSRDTSDTNTSTTPYMLIRLIRSIKEKSAKKAVGHQVVSGITGVVEQIVIILSIGHFLGNPASSAAKVNLYRNSVRKCVSIP